MIDATEKELASIRESADAGAEYIKELGVYDLRKLSDNQLDQFARCICNRFVEHQAMDG